MKRVILVIGIHRSGTSVLTKGLETMGVVLGSNFIPTTIYNKTGFWEDEDFHILNFTMLVSFQDRLRGLLALTEEDVDLLCNRGFLEAASRLLLSKLPSSSPLGIKDPRFSVLLPFWKRVFLACNVTPSFVIALRDPLSVAAAHEHVKTGNREQSLRIWSSYLLACLEHSEGYDRLLVDYDIFLKDPSYQIQRMAHTLQLPINQVLLDSYLNDFIDSSLRHFHNELEDHLHNNFWKNLALEIYEHLLSIATEQHSFEKIRASLEKWKDQFKPMIPLLALEDKNDFLIKKLLENNAITPLQAMKFKQ